MPTFTNYIVNSGDTLASIASKILGSFNRWTEFVAWNRLRYPYISDNPKDQLGIIRGSFLLEEDLDIGASSTKITNTLVSSGALSVLSLRKGNKLFFTSYTNDGDIIHDTVSIRAYKQLTSRSTSTLFFDFPTISPPSVDPIVSGLAFVGTPPEVAGTPVSTNSNSPVVAGYYYISYSYVNFMRVETALSPFSNYFDEVSKKQFRKTLFLSESDIIDGKRIIFHAPSIFPDGVKAINIYISKKSDVSIEGQESAPTMWHQSTITATFPTYIPLADSAGGYLDTSCYFVFKSYYTNKQYAPSENLVTSGISFKYPAGTIVTIHDDPAESDTYVLKTGDILKIPTQNSQSISSIGTFATDTPTDSLGADISIDIVGQISFSGQGGNDIDTSSGYNNVRQSLRSRLSTPYGSLILQPEYGNKALNTLGSSYSLNLLEEIRLLCIECVYEDPRVLAVTSITVSYDKDTAAIFVSNFEIQTTANESVINIDPLSVNI